jgi:hypothetical protein
MNSIIGATRRRRYGAKRIVHVSTPVCNHACTSCVYVRTYVRARTHSRTQCDSRQIQRQRHARVHNDRHEGSDVWDTRWELGSVCAILFIQAGSVLPLPGFKVTPLFRCHWLRRACACVCKRRRGTEQQRQEEEEETWKWRWFRTRIGGNAGSIAEPVKRLLQGPRII